MLNQARGQFSGLTPDKVAQYLDMQGWLNDLTIANGNAAIWHRREPELRHWEILQPLSLELSDYTRRMFSLLESLSQYEKRDMDAVIADIALYSCDQVRIQVVHEDVIDGSIPLIDGVALFERAKDLLAAAARSTFVKKRNFIGKMSEEAVGYLAKARLGQTQHGSYIVNLITPLLPDNSSQQDSLSVPLARSISDTLGRSLTAIQCSIDDYRETQKEVSFDAAVATGVSANLCDALIGLSGSEQKRHVSIKIRFASAGDDGKSETEHHFQPEMMELIKRASDYYKQKYTMYATTVTGLVTKLSHESKDDFEITMAGVINGEVKNVSVELPDEAFWRAHHALRTGQAIECTGDIVVSPRSVKMTRLSRFAMAGTGDDGILSLDFD